MGKVTSADNLNFFTMRLTFFCIGWLITCLVSARSYTYVVENPSAFDRPNQPVVLTVSEWGGTMPTGYPAAECNGKQVPVQADDLDKDGKTDELALTVSMKAAETLTLSIQFKKKPSSTVFPKRVHAQLFRKEGKENVPVKEASSPTGSLYNQLHHHGPAFESEYMAYRLYFDKKQTIDVYGKKTHRLELAESLWYPNDDQLARGFGDDILLVKDYVSVGTFKGWDGQKALHIDPVTNRTARIVANGPVRTVVEMVVENWDYHGQPVQLTNRVILYAGHRDIEVVNYLSAPDLTALPFCTGVQTFPEMTMYEKDRVLAVWGRNWPVNDTIKYEKETVGLAVFCPAEVQEKPVQDKFNYLYIFKGQPVIRYWATVFWKKEEGGVQTAEAFFNQLPRWRQSLDETIRIFRK